MSSSLDTAYSSNPRKKVKTKSKANREKDGRLVLTMSESVLNEKPRETLLEHLEDLSAYARVLEKKLKMPVSVPVDDAENAQNAENENPNNRNSEEAAALSANTAASEAQLSALKSTILKGIQRQMIWKAVCKYGVSSCVFEGFANPEIFAALVQSKIPNLTRKKSHKIPLADFCSILGRHEITQGIRYGQLIVKSEFVTVAWDSVLNHFKISAKYGKDS